MKFFPKDKYLFPFIFIFSFLFFLAHIAYTKTALYSDTRFYYAYTRSLVIDRDILLTNDFQLLGIEPAINSEGFAVNTFPVGTSLFWVPGFWLADSFMKATQFLQSSSLIPSGFEIPYQIATAATNIFLGTLGLYLLYSLLRKYFSETIARLTAITLFSTTNLLFYFAVEPLTSHATSFFVSTLFVYYFLKHKKDKYYYLILGLLGGFAGLVRTQDALILVVPIIQIIVNSKTSLKFLVTNFILLFAGFLVGFAPQIFLWKLFFDFYYPPPGWGYGFTFLSPHILYVLFNRENGLFILTPSVFLAFIGLFSLFLRKWHIALFSLTYFFLQIYFISSWQEYFQGGSFSIRMMISSYPFLSFGLAEIMTDTRNRFGYKALYHAITLFSLLNFGLILRYLYIT